jgi:hypothetical protein
MNAIFFLHNSTEEERLQETLDLPKLQEVSGKEQYSGIFPDSYSEYSHQVRLLGFCDTAEWK